MRMSVNSEWIERAIILLKAAHVIIEKSGDAQAQDVFYDGTLCDGVCLLADIKSHLDELK